MQLSRRELLASVAGTLTLADLAFSAQHHSVWPTSRLAMPGPYRGRVVSVFHPASIAGGQYQAQPIKQVMERGMLQLTGAPDLASAWKIFFEPSDVVGIKLNPVGLPHVISDATVVREIIAGLQLAGVRLDNIVIFDRYRDQFVKAGFAKWVPQGVRSAWATGDVDPRQQNIEGYDPDHYMDMALTLPGQEITEDVARRSHAALFITRQVNKLVNLCSLKDHQSAGITIALKNLSHGLVNNVSRSHSTPTLNACNSFIPAVASMPVIRNKTVLHICDGVKGVFHGGPFAPPAYVWEHKTMYFATDPVALDRVGWTEIDKRRGQAGLPPVAQQHVPDKVSTFIRRQPEHVEIAGALGLGEYDQKKIDLRRVALG